MSTASLISSVMERQAYAGINRNPAVTIHITKEITEAYNTYLDQVVDSDVRGNPIRRRDTEPFRTTTFTGLVDFAAGWQIGQAKGQSS